MSVATVLPLVLIVLVGYLLIVRPTRKRSQAAQRLQSSLAPGDQVMLTSGIFARLVDLEHETAHVELAPGVVVRVHRRAVGQIIVDPTGDLAKDATSAEDPEDAGEDVSHRAGETPGDDSRGVS
ncbi:MAG: preprotein translocase subunit YajC [Nocardioidaceae bacterium]|nr:preprotein translocase subunit YajC [Nocardioidaceae bacterium]